jgi:hypothetical protein
MAIDPSMMPAVSSSAETSAAAPRTLTHSWVSDPASGWLADRTLSAGLANSSTRERSRDRCMDHLADVDRRMVAATAAHVLGGMTYRRYA